MNEDRSLCLVPALQWAHCEATTLPLWFCIWKMGVNRSLCVTCLKNTKCSLNETGPYIDIAWDTHHHKHHESNYQQTDHGDMSVFPNPWLKLLPALNSWFVKIIPMSLSKEKWFGGPSTPSELRPVHCTVFVGCVVEDVHLPSGNWTEGAMYRIHE